MKAWVFRTAYTACFLAAGWYLKDDAIRSIVLFFEGYVIYLIGRDAE
jgi:hypothetical protein